jgi:hypothetical protein
MLSSGLLLVTGVVAAADIVPPAASAPPITLSSLMGTGGLTFATWLLAATYQQASGKSSKLIALVAAFGLSITVQFLTDAGPAAQVVLLGVLNGCQAYLAAAGVATVAGAATGASARSAVEVQSKRTFFSGWF